MASVDNEDREAGYEITKNLRKENNQELRIFKIPKYLNLNATCLSEITKVGDPDASASSFKEYVRYRFVAPKRNPFTSTYSCHSQAVEAALALATKTVRAAASSKQTDGNL